MKNHLRGLLSLSLLITLLVGCSGPAPITPAPSATPPPMLAATHTSTVPPLATATVTATPTLEPTPTPSAILPTITPAPRGQQQWTLARNLPATRLEQAAVELNGKIYVLGGADARFTALARVEVYDPRTDVWSSAAPLPEPRHHLGAAALEGKIYVVGGYVGASPQNEAWRYDPSTNTWEAIAPLPRGQAAHALVALGGKLYLVGGNGAVLGGGPQRLWRYDPTTNTWDDTLAKLPTGREHLAAVAADGKIWAIGGRIDVGPNLPLVEIYDPATDTWTRGPDLLRGTSGLTAGVLEGRIHVTGGEDLGSFATIGEHQILDLQTLTWEAGPRLPTPRHGLSSAVVDGRWYLIAGGPSADLSASGRVDVFTP